MLYGAVIAGPVLLCAPAAAQQRVVMLDPTETVELEHSDRKLRLSRAARQLAVQPPPMFTETVIDRSVLPDTFKTRPVGASAGGALCAVMLAVANEKDKQRIAELQAQAFAEGSRQTIEYVGDDKKKRTLVADLTEAPSVEVAGETLLCRRVNTSIAVEGAGAASVPAEIKCRSADGSWNLPPPPGTVTAT